MNIDLEEKRKNRFRLLRALYDETKGVAEYHLIDIRQIGKEIGIKPDVALDTFEYLKGEGLTKWMALGGVGTITHWGIKEVEDAFDNKPTAHFPANILSLTINAGANVNINSGTIFDQRNQNVENQYNSAGDINIGQIKDFAGLIDQLNNIKHEITKAYQNQLIDELIESKVRTQILEAIEESKKQQPDKGNLLKYLDSAKQCLNGIAGVKNIIEGISEIYKWAENIIK